MLEKTERVEKLAPALVSMLGGSKETMMLAALAAGIARADLATQLVQEFTSLAVGPRSYLISSASLTIILCSDKLYKIHPAFKSPKVAQVSRP